MQSPILKAVNAVLGFSCTFPLFFWAEKEFSMQNSITILIIVSSMSYYTIMTYAQKAFEFFKMLNGQQKKNENDLIFSILKLFNFWKHHAIWIRNFLFLMVKNFMSTSYKNGSTYYKNWLTVSIFFSPIIHSHSIMFKYTSYTNINWNFTELKKKQRFKKLIVWMDALSKTVKSTFKLNGYNLNV